MNKIRIALVSLLKPINDTRLYEKLGFSLRALPGAEVHVCGYEAPPPAHHEGVFFHPVFRFRRISFGRLLAQIKYLRLMWKLQPELIIVGTHELLFASVLYKLFAGCRLVYDIRENYALNLCSQHIYPPLVRQLLAGLVRATEHICAPFISHHLLAEQSYASELSFVQDNYTVLENKLRKERNVHWQQEVRINFQQSPVRLLYSGTISRLYGVFEAVELCRQLRSIQTGFTLDIIGYCPQPEVLQELQACIADKPYIRLTGGDGLVPHPQILACIRQSHVGLLPYQPHESTFNCIPTKMYEYMGHALPMLIQHNLYWQSLVNRHQAGIFIDFSAPDPRELYERLQQACFYPAGVPEEVFWEQEEPKLLQKIKEVLHLHL